MGMMGVYSVLIPFANLLQALTREQSPCTTTIGRTHAHLSPCVFPCLKGNRWHCCTQHQRFSGPPKAHVLPIFTPHWQSQRAHLSPHLQVLHVFVSCGAESNVLSGMPRSIISSWSNLWIVHKKSAISSGACSKIYKWPLSIFKWKNYINLMVMLTSVNLDNIIIAKRACMF